MNDVHAGKRQFCQRRMHGASGLWRTGVLDLETPPLAALGAGRHDQVDFPARVSRPEKALPSINIKNIDEGFDNEALPGSANFRVPMQFVEGGDV